jgi:hypothetical protein
MMRAVSLPFVLLLSAPATFSIYFSCLGSIRLQLFSFVKRLTLVTLPVLCIVSGRRSFDCHVLHQRTATSGSRMTPLRRQIFLLESIQRREIMFARKLYNQSAPEREE